MPRIGADAHLVMALCDVERLREFSRAGTKPPNVIHSASGLHQNEAAPRFERANQNEAAALAALHQQVQHPVDAVIHIDVNGAGFVLFDKRARARPGKSMARFVIQSEIRLHLHHGAGTFSPHQLGPDEFARADQRVTLKESAVIPHCKNT